MPIYGGPYGESASPKRTGYYDSPGSSGSVVTQAPPSVVTQTDPFNGPGSVNFDLTDPQTAAQQAQQTTSDAFSGLRSFLFGTDAPGANGKRGGVLGVGDIPVVGDALRGVSAVPGAIGSAVGGAIGAVGEGLRRVPSPSRDLVSQQIEDAFNALPDSSAAKQEALKSIEADKGLLGTGLLDAHLSYMNDAIQKAADENPQPSLFGGMFKPAASLGDEIGNLFGLLGTPVRLVERGVAGWDKASGLNQLDNIVAVGSGNASWTADDPGLTPVEKIAYDRYTSGAWDQNQALDWLSSHGAGFSHNKLLELASNVALDPLSDAALGAGAVAKLGKLGSSLLDMQRAASSALEVAQAAGDAGKVAEAQRALDLVSQGIKSGEAADSVGARNILGQLAKSPVTGDIARKFGAVYEGLDGTMIGRVAKITRTMVDPMHAWGANPKIAASIEEGSTEVAHAVARAHGEFTLIDTAQHLAETPGLGREFADQLEQGLAVYSGNVLRRVAGRGYRAVQMATAAGSERLVSIKPFEAIKDMMAQVTKRTMTQLEEEAGKFIKRNWNPADRENLADRLATLWGGLTKDEWMTELDNPRWTPAKMSLLHSATYGSAVRQLQDAREAVRASGQSGIFADRLHQLVLLNKQTLTDLGAEGIKTRIADAVSNEAKRAIVDDAKRLYPELRNFVDDPTSDANTVNEFLDMLDRKINFLPAQIRDAERAQLPGALGEFDDKTRNVYTIGFRPKDEFLWGVEPGADGVLKEVGDPWLDQVSDNLRGYMPVREAAFNVAGKPITEQIVGRTARMLDAAEAAGRVALHGVTGAMVSNAAHAKFVSSVLAKYEPSGLTSTQVENIWKALMAKVDDSENISGMRGLSRDAIWNAAKEVIPGYAERAGLDRRTLLMHVLDAYDGDLRYIGLTQKFTGRAKVLAAQLTGANTAGVISEHMWPLLKFRLNAFFQLQEKIEPWVLNAQRGASVAIGTKMTATDRATAAVYRNFVEKNLINMGDNDIAELARKMGWGKGLEAASRQEGGKIAFLRSKLEAMNEVQGVKQLNMLRTWQHGLGSELKAVWEQNLPGEWDKMLNEARVNAGGLISDDEFAVRLASENLAANHILVRRMSSASGVPGGWEAEFANAIKTGQWAAPQSLGELRPLDLDHLVERIGLRDSTGRDVATTMGLREGLASGRVSIDDVTRALRDMGAHPDYINRAESAFRFSWRNFWDDAAETFSLTPEERRGFEGMFRQIAAGRDMTPVEYMSQVYSPSIANGGEAAVGSLGNLVDFSRNGRVEQVPDLARLAGSAGQSTVEDLYKQMGAVMSQHLDPSAKRAFLGELMGPDAELPDSISDIANTWDQLGASDELSNRIMRFVQGAPGDGAHNLVADEATGVAKVRDAATTLRSQAGRPRNLQRVVYDDNPALARETADAYDALPDTFRHVATPEQLATKVEPDAVALTARHRAIDFKPEFTALPRQTQAAYKAYGTESRKLYNYLTGQMHIQVKPGRAYATADALRKDLARGRLRVPATGYWHPAFNNEDLFMQRAVHDAFGYGQEANALGSHDAAFSAAAMYSDDARRVAISDDFARSAWEAHSGQVIPQAVAEPQTVEEYEARWGRSSSQPVNMADELNNNGGFQSRSLGAGVRALPEHVQRELISNLGVIRNQFPGVPLEAVDVARLPQGTAAATLTGLARHPSDMAHPTIVFDSGWSGSDIERRDYRILRNSAQHRAIDFGRVPETASGTAVGDIYHEFGHVFDSHVRDIARKAALQPSLGLPNTKPIADLLDEFGQSAARSKLSLYAAAGITDPNLGPAESTAELFDLAFNPDHSERLMSGAIAPELEQYVQALRSEAKKAGIWKPDGVAAPVNPLAGQTIAQANAGGAGIRAAHKVGLLPQDLTDRLTQTFLGSGRFAESNPDVARMAAFLHDHMSGAASHVLQHGTASEYARLFDHMSGMPVSDIAPFNFTEAKLWNAAAQSMASKWEDAFRLQYFAQNRSMFQRSINHPMFGLYPASYMWGKIGPELVRFIAREPFGMRTGAGAYTIADIQRAVAVQRQYDPGFDKTISDLGQNPALGFLGYMLPATPWSVPSSYPAWMRDMSQQGLQNQASVANGGDITDDNFITPLSAVVKRVFPYTTTVPWFGRAASAVGDALPWNQPPPPQSSVDAAGNPVGQSSQPAPSLAAPVGAVDINPILSEQMQSLQDLLGGR